MNKDIIKEPSGDWKDLLKDNRNIFSLREIVGWSCWSTLGVALFMPYLIYFYDDAKHTPIWAPAYLIIPFTVGGFVWLAGSVVEGMKVFTTVYGGWTKSIGAFTQKTETRTVDSADTSANEDGSNDDSSGSVIKTETKTSEQTMSGVSTEPPSEELPSPGDIK